MMNGDQVAYQIDMQVGVRLKGMNALCNMFDNLPHAWPWGQIRSVEQAIREQLRDNWEMPGGEGAPEE